MKFLFYFVCFYKLCEANFLFSNHLLICSDQYFYENLNLPRMALEAEPLLRPIPLLLFRGPRSPREPSSEPAHRATGRGAEHPSHSHFTLLVVDAVQVLSWAKFTEDF